MGNEPRRRRRVASLVVVAAHLGDGEGKIGLEMVEERRLADAALADDGADGAAELGPETGDAHAGDSGAEDDAVPHPRVDASEGDEAGRGDEIGFVEADQGPDAGALRGDEHPVDEPRLEMRLGRAADDHHLIDIGDDHVTASAAVPRQFVAPGIDRLDRRILADAVGSGRRECVGGKIGDRRLTDGDPVARHHRMPLVDRHRAKDAAGRATDDMAVGLADEALQPVDVEHLPTPGVDGDVCPRLDDRPLARQIPLAGETFGSRHVGEPVGVVTERPGQVATAPPDGAILAEVDPYLAGFRHAANQGRSPRVPAEGGSGRRAAGPGAEE